MVISTCRTPPWMVDLIDTGVETMTGGRLQMLEHYLSDGTFMLTYGDGLSNVDFDKLVAFHKAHGKVATMTVVNPHTTFGHLQFDDTGLVKDFIEKPDTAKNLINGGFFVLEPRVFASDCRCDRYHRDVGTGPPCAF